MPKVFHNAAELEREFNRISYVMQRQILTAAAKAGAELIRDEAERLAPRDTGQLAESELIRVEGRQSDSSEVVVKIGPDKDSFYGRFQEFGTAFHPAQPFLRPALKATQEEAAKVSAKVVKERLERLG